MIEEPPVLRVRKSWKRPSREQVKAFEGVPTGFVTDCMDGHGALAQEIAPVEGLPVRIAGPALTAGNGPADILGTLGAIHACQPGDVIVAAVSGYQGCAAIGDRVCGMARNAGAVGIVTDGPVRDLDGIERVGLPTFATGITPNSPNASGPGTVGLPVEIGGRRVESGDMVVADRDGVVIVPFAKIDSVIARLAEVRSLEEALDARVEDGFREPIAELWASERVSWED